MALQPLHKTDKPWGHELLWARTAEYAGKLLHIKRGHRLSLQYHERKEETILVYSGRMLFQIEDGGGVLREIYLDPGMPHPVPVGRKHRMIALEDAYGRADAVAGGQGR